MPVADSGMETRVLVTPTSSLKQGQVLDFGHNTLLMAPNNLCLKLDHVFAADKVFSVA